MCLTNHMEKTMSRLLKDKVVKSTILNIYRHEYISHITHWILRCPINDIPYNIGLRSMIFFYNS